MGKGRTVRKISRVLKAMLATLVGVFVLLLTWGVLVEPRLILNVQQERAEIPGLPAAWEGQRVAVFGDFQIGMWLDNREMVERIVGLILEEQPAAVLITGDFLYATDQEPAQQIARAVELVQPLPAAGIPTYTVLGNHDYGLKTPHGTPDLEQAARLEAALEEGGITVLHNEAVRLPSSDTSNPSPLYLVGVGSAWADADRPEQALSSVPDGAPRLMLMHNPESFSEVPTGAAPLALAGHTHGGQVSLPFTPQWSWLTYLEEDELHADGWIRGYGAPDNHLYVNHGVGFSLLPLRLNCPPELTVLTLRGA